MPPDLELLPLLRLCAHLDWGEAHARELVVLAGRVTAWADLVNLAEAHGLAPLVARRLADTPVELPASARQALFAFTCLHDDANRTRFRVLAQILRAFASRGIAVVLLKGAALAHLLYTSPGLRPLSDIDLLVDDRSAAQAVATLRALGFGDPPSRLAAPAARHHHLPALVTTVDGVEVRVELHRNALSFDAPGSLALGDTMEPLQSFTVEGQEAWAFGHTDMLWHLCRHLAQPARLVRLIWVADIVGYAARCWDAVSWQPANPRHHFVLNTLALLDPLVALPPPMRSRVPVTTAVPPRGLGVASKPLGDIFTRRPIGDVWRDVCDPSDWWLRLHYGVAPGTSLWWHRGVHHPLRVGRWLARRALGAR